MDDVESVNVDKTFEDLAEQAPNLFSILPDVPLDKITQRLYLQYVRYLNQLNGLLGRSEYYPFVTILHRDVHYGL